MASNGEVQEARAREFVQRLGYSQVIWPEDNIRVLLHMHDASKCADIIGFRPSFQHAVSAIVCESKGTEVDHALVQLGNVAAAMLEHFASERRMLSTLVLLAYCSRVHKSDVGDSPGPGYLTGEPNHFGLRALIDAGAGEGRLAPATASIDLKRLDVRFIRWGERVAKLPVYVYVEP